MSLNMTLRSYSVTCVVFFFLSFFELERIGTVDSGECAVSSDCSLVRRVPSCPEKFQNTPNSRLHLQHAL